MVIGVDTIHLEGSDLEVGGLEARARSASHPGIMGP
jgi:hypothetical protein